MKGVEENGSSSTPNVTVNSNTSTINNNNKNNGETALRKGPWMPEEDEILVEYMRQYGPRDWSSIRSKGLLPRTGKSCRLRWVNKLKPDLKRYACQEKNYVQTVLIISYIFFLTANSYYYRKFRPNICNSQKKGMNETSNLSIKHIRSCIHKKIGYVHLVNFSSYIAALKGLLS